jgi:two-component system, cell cycle sensor histidine kinase and response regulator CckA
MGLRILIVEDEQIVSADLEGKLALMGQRVVGIAASGEEALALAEQLKPDLVLMDIRLQGEMDGTEAARRIQRSIGAAIIFITAYAEIFVEDPKLMRPPGLCLNKPFSMKQLRAVIATLT